MPGVAIRPPPLLRSSHLNLSSTDPLQQLTQPIVLNRMEIPLWAKGYLCSLHVYSFKQEPTPLTHSCNAHELTFMRLA